MTARIDEIAPDRYRVEKGQRTPEHVLKSIVGNQHGQSHALMPLYEPQAAFAAQPGSLAYGLPASVNRWLAFIAMKGTLDLNVTRVVMGPETRRSLRTMTCRCADRTAKCSGRPLRRACISCHRCGCSSR